ncbi:CDP-alcohol phosphatidyltransferase family protein [Sphingomonas sp.]|uniref:CDP-alcohol phosphatidyltransferase family protein n=1 Tax=Sphingomonas sp. TaxID=28214 RepID=UPI002CA528B7|nr:CDP-alcohol phosphatidyltransferase family protein [Sphingomonas sp.]HWK35226.1 CDP-alcohol phosphatidyltransferase family protein [Sphingomonas sp.]
MSQNTVIHRIVRPAVRLIAPTRITPNHITTLRLATGLAAAFCFARGTAGALAVGAAIFLLSLLLDRADGELARQTGRMSRAGHRYDLAADCIASVAAFVGLGIGLIGSHGSAALWTGVVAGIGIGTLFAELNVINIAQVRGLDLSDGITVDPDDAMVLVPLLIWGGLAWPMTIAAAVITPVAALVLALLALRSRRR